MLEFVTSDNFNFMPKIEGEEGLDLGGGTTVDYKGPDRRRHDDPSLTNESPHRRISDKFAKAVGTAMAGGAMFVATHVGTATSSHSNPDGPETPKPGPVMPIEPKGSSKKKAFGGGASAPDSDPDAEPDSIPDSDAGLKGGIIVDSTTGEESGVDATMNTETAPNLINPNAEVDCPVYGPLPVDTHGGPLEEICDPTEPAPKEGQWIDKGVNCRFSDSAAPNLMLNLNGTIVMDPKKTNLVTLVKGQVEEIILHHKVENQTVIEANQQKMSAYVKTTCRMLVQKIEAKEGEPGPSISVWAIEGRATIQQNGKIYILEQGQQSDPIPLYALEAEQEVSASQEAKDNSGGCSCMIIDPNMTGEEHQEGNQTGWLVTAAGAVIVTAARRENRKENK